MGRLRRRTSSSAPASEAPVAAGTVVAGFTVQQVLRPGDGRWTVTEATDPGGTPVLLHVSTRAAASDPGERERVARLERLGAVDELPLVPLAGAGADGEVLYVARACPDGRTLADRLREGTLDPDEATRMLSQVAGAMETLRAFGVPFDHVTPERILLTARRPGQALLSDYGFGPPAGRACERAELLAVADYLAPEAAQGEAVQPASSVYALACVLFECLTGAPPYPYDRPLLVLEAHAAGPPPRVSERADVPRELDRVLMTALSPRPEQRQATPATLLSATQRALGGRRVPIPVVEPAPEAPVCAERAKAPEGARPAAPEAAPRRARWPAPAGAGMAALLVVAGTAGFATANLQTGTDPGTPSTATVRARAATAPDPHAAYLRAVDRVVQRLDARRTDGRRDLGAARHAGTQAAAALRVARVYLDARRALPAAPSAVGRDAELGPPLAATERAYRLLAAAARRHDARGFRSASHAVTTGEQDVTATLTGLDRSTPQRGNS
jgi:serine/threonine-protein kinase